jgi:hypothetical protein
MAGPQLERTLLLLYSDNYVWSEPCLIVNMSIVLSGSSITTSRENNIYVGTMYSLV